MIADLFELFRHIPNAIAHLYKDLLEALPDPVLLVLPFGIVWGTIALNVAYWPGAGPLGVLLLGAVNIVAPAMAVAAGVYLIGGPVLGIVWLIDALL